MDPMGSTRLITTTFCNDIKAIIFKSYLSQIVTLYKIFKIFTVIFESSLRMGAFRNYGPYFTRFYIVIYIANNIVCTEFSLNPGTIFV